MIDGIKAEIRKLFTVRSTYILMGFAAAVMVLYDFYIIGFKQGVNSALINSRSSHFVMAEVTRGGGILVPILFSALIAVLLMAHEYRYNTIMYTLTTSNSRNKTLLAKIITITGFSIIFSAISLFLGLALARLGLHVHHVILGPQVFYYREVLERVLFVGWAYGMIGILLAVLFRNLVASIVALLMIPGFIEPLFALMLNNNQQQYLPFMALTAVLNNGIERIGPGLISAGRSALVALIYIVITWAIAWYLFLKRDAN